MSLLGKILHTGRVAEKTPARPRADGPAVQATPTARGPLKGSIQIRHVDAGSCNGCEIEIANAFGPVYDAERYGVRLIASPRHADALLVTGPVTRNMADPLRATYAATPAPKCVVAFGDCALNCGVFVGAYGVEGSVGDVISVDVEVPGCPPSPDALIEALRRLTGR